MKTRVHVLVGGRVQGVYFRSSTWDEARIYGVKGWVRNRRDGSVEAVFEGEEEAVKKMVAFCHQGPPEAHVTEVQEDWQDHRGEFDDFRIKY